MREKRPRCAACHRPYIACYCGRIKPFDSDPRFIILIHPEEAKRPIATGRMAHLALSNSLLVEGVDFTESDEVNAVLADPSYHCVVLFPGPSSTDLSRLTTEERARLTPTGKKLAVIVLDGTWRTAKRIKRLSTNLRPLPGLCFSPDRPSLFGKVRRQPRPECFSTIEAIHTVIELLTPHVASPPGVPATPTQPHYNLLDVFAFMIEQQLDYLSQKGL